MRVLIAIVGLTVGIILAPDAARAADIPPPGSGHYPAIHAYPPVGYRAVPDIVYDFEPGIAVRPYWLPPWAYRHYYPTNRGVRRHRVRHVIRRQRRAERFERYWSTDPLIVEEYPAYFEPPLPPPRPLRHGYFGP